MGHVEERAALIPVHSGSKRSVLHVGGWLGKVSSDLYGRQPYHSHTESVRNKGLLYTSLRLNSKHSLFDKQLASGTVYAHGKALKIVDRYAAYGLN